MTVTSSVLDAIGGTRLLDLSRVTLPGSGRLLAKLESSNPTGSMKDRMAHAGVEAALSDGRLMPGQPIVEYTGGSTGTSLALVAAALGHPMWIVYSDAFSHDKLRHMAALGARLTMVNSFEGQITEQLTKTLVEHARRIGEREGAWWFDQLRNQPCSRGFEVMGEEIWEQSAGEVDAFVQCVGTSHSLLGATRAIRSHRPDVMCIAVEPAESPVLSGGRGGAHQIDGIGLGFLPPLWEPELVDRIHTVSTQEAMEMARRLAIEEAVLVGTSSGANVAAAMRVAKELGSGSTVVTVLVDSGAKYFSTRLFDQAVANAVQATVELIPLDELD